MSETSIRLNLDSSGLTSGAKQGLDSVNGLVGAIGELGEAASKATDPKDVEKVLEGIRKLNSELQTTQKNMPGFGGVSQSLNNNGNAKISESKDNTAAEIARLKSVIETLNRSIEKASDKLQEATEQESSRDTVHWTTSLNQMEEAKQRATNELKRLETQDKDKTLDAFLKDRKAQLFSQGVNYAVQGAAIYNGYRSSIANGDYLNAGVQVKDNVGSAVMGLGGTLTSVGGIIAASGVGAIPGLVVAGVGALATGAGGLIKILAGDESADNAEANAYEKSLNVLNSFNKRYVNNGTWKDNAERTDKIREQATELAKETGFSTYDLVNTATSFSGYGLVTKDIALKKARIAALWANSTGADLGTITDVIGTSQRMGRSLDTGFLSQARNATGLSKGQTQEFLTSLQSVVENGISNGYAKSTEDVAKNFVMFSKLSDNNPLWEGKYAAQKIGTINSSLAGATALNDTNQMIIVEGAKKVVDNMSNADFMRTLNTKYGKTGTYIDYMLMTENGLTPEMFNTIGASIRGLEGNNLAARVERWKGISGLNYKGALELDKMYGQGLSSTEITERINAMRKDETYASEETVKQDKINSIDANVQKIGQSKFWDNFDKLDDLAKKYDGNAHKNDADMADNTGFTTRVKEGNYKAAVEEVFKTGSIKTAAAHGGLPAGYGGTTYENLTGEETWQYVPSERKMVKIGGNDAFDELFKEKVGMYAAIDDGKVSEGEVRKALAAHDKKEVQDAYNSGNQETYLAALEKMLTSLFGKIQVQSN